MMRPTRLDETAPRAAIRADFGLLGGGRSLDRTIRTHAGVTAKAGPQRKVVCKARLGE